MSDVIQANVQLWRQKAADGTITLEEMRLAIAAIRKERVGAQEVSTKSKTAIAATAKKKAVVDSEDLLGQLGDL